MTMSERDLVELKARVERLEATVSRLVGDQRPVAPPTPGESLDQEQLLAWLKAERLVRDPTPEECRFPLSGMSCRKKKNKTISVSCVVSFLTRR